MLAGARFFRTLAFALFSPFSFTFSVPNLVVTLSTRFADASLKYLRFSREIDWNNFSHTDSFEPPTLARAQPKQKDDDFSSAAIWCFAASLCVAALRPVGLSKIYSSGKLSLLLMNFHENFSSLDVENAKHSFLDYFFVDGPTLVNNTLFFRTELYYPEAEN